MKIHECAQNDLEWITLRVGKVTASEADALLTPLFKPREGAQVHTYLCQKVAEAYRGKPIIAFAGSWETEQGAMLEDEARKWLALYTDHKVRNVGFIEHDNGRCGCSPDAFLDDEGGLELKCPQELNHVRYLLDGTLPKDYAVQVHFSLYVSGRPWWKFISYRRHFPPFVLKVERDEAICAKIEAALANFYGLFDAAMAKLKSL